MSRSGSMARASATSCTPARAAGRARANDAGKMDARIVDTLDDATALSSPPATCCDDRWRLGLGWTVCQRRQWPALEEGAGLLTFKRELRELESRVGELADQLIIADVAVKQPGPGLTGLEETVVLLNASIAREDREAMARELNYGTLQQDIERAGRHLRVVEDDSARLQQDSRSWRPRGSRP